MSLQLIGYEVKQGEFADERTGRKIEFDNIELHVMGDEFPVGKVADGKPVDRIKVKRTDFEKWVSYVSMSDLIGKTITPMYTIYNGKPTLNGFELE